MKILFLTNNPVTRPLYEWLSQREDVIYREEKISADDISGQGIEFVISYNYFFVIQPEVISLLPHRIINLHISYLPWNRGSSPNIFSFLENTPAGVTIHEINSGLDKGDILVQQLLSFDYSIETLRSSYEKSHAAIQNLFYKNWENIKQGKITPFSQIGQGSYHRKSDIELYRSILNYDDCIEVFLNKAKTCQQRNEL